MVFCGSVCNLRWQSPVCWNCSKVTPCLGKRYSLWMFVLRKSSQGSHFSKFTWNCHPQFCAHRQRRTSPQSKAVVFSTVCPTVSSKVCPVPPTGTRASCSSSAAQSSPTEIVENKWILHFMCDLLSCGRTPYLPRTVQFWIFIDTWNTVDKSKGGREERWKTWVAWLSKLWINIDEGWSMQVDYSHIWYTGFFVS